MPAWTHVRGERITGENCLGVDGLRQCLVGVGDMRTKRRALRPERGLHAIRRIVVGVL
jgi:hypothetical protein